MFIMSHICMYCVCRIHKNGYVYLLIDILNLFFVVLYSSCHFLKNYTFSKNNTLDFSLGVVFLVSDVNLGIKFCELNFSSTYILFNNLLLVAKIVTTNILSSPYKNMLRKKNVTHLFNIIVHLFI